MKLKITLVPLFAAVAVALVACSLVLGKLEATNCDNDGDCRGLATQDPAFAGSICDPVARVCTTTQKEAGVDAPPECKSNKECSQQLGGQPAVCVRENGRGVRCARLEGASCTLEPRFTKWSDDDAVVFAHVDSFSLQASVAPMIVASTMALAEINKQTDGLPAVTSGGTPRPIVLLKCDYKQETVKETINFLSTAGVLGLIGPGFGDALQQVETYTKPKGMFVIGTADSSPVISGISRNDPLLWRVAASAEHEANLARAFIAKAETDIRAKLSLPTSQKIRVAEVFTDSANSAALEAAFVKGLTFNGVTGTPSTPSTAEFNSQKYKAVGSNFGTIQAALQAFQPHIIVVLDEGAFARTLSPQFTETAPWSAPFKPTWVFTGYSGLIFGGTSLSFYASKDADTRSRFFIMATRDTTPELYADLVRRFKTEPGAPQTAFPSNIQYAYDAAYFLAYAYYAGGRLKVPSSGTDIREGAKLLLPTGPAEVPVGPGTGTQISDNFNTLGIGKFIDLKGTTNNLNFGGTTGEVGIDQITLAVRCYGTCKPDSIPPCETSSEGGVTYVPKETGLIYNPTAGGGAGGLSGTFTCD